MKKINRLNAFTRAFTLAEIMIVLTVVGVLTAILLPAAFHAAPDENIMKFKKANSTLGTVIRELVNSDEYYSRGSLAIKPDGTYVDSARYFCDTFSDVISVKSNNCIKYANSTSDYNATGYLSILNDDWYGKFFVKEKIDEICLAAAKNVGEEIVASDNIIYYEASPGAHFGIQWKDYHGSSSPLTEEALNRRVFTHQVNASGFLSAYKIFCIDVDGIDKGEAPFGYGIRGDGKIFPGARATEWMEKSVQNKD